MAAPTSCVELLGSLFPDIDPQISNYVTGIIEDSADDFDTADDIYEAIGALLLDSATGKTEDDVFDICEKFHGIVKSSQSSDTMEHKVLNSPIQIGSLSLNTRAQTVEPQSIWLTKKENVSQVDQKKLEKAEAKLQKKNEKRASQTTTVKKVTNGNCELASASQQLNRRDTKMDAAGSNKSYDIRIENFDVSYGEKSLLVDASIHLIYGRRYGFVGRNGLGKTTVLQMISSGQLKIPSHITILHVEQEVVGDETLALQSVLESDQRRENLLREERDINTQLQDKEGNDSTDGLSARLSEIYHQLEAIDADKAPAKAAVILAGLGFTPKMQGMHTREFSGGWRMRLALARALFSKPDLLLLDEPTNMLDMKAIIWLEDYLQTWTSTILVVSHDRQFLNAVATDILYLHSGRIDTYKGNYETFMKSREDRLKNQQKEYEAQQQYREHIQVFIDRFRYNANRASQVQSKLKLLEKLPELKPVAKESEVILKFPECNKLSPPILQLDEVTFYYSEDQVIFHNICVSASMESRICIVGENGAGKTTLLKILLGELNPVKGLRNAHRNLKIGYFSQHHVDQLEMDISSIELLALRYTGKPIEMYRSILGSFGVTGELATRSVASLSGGQKSRVAFAAMSVLCPNFFILDEPTNHLDVETIEALGKALQKFQGGVILVSHDERLIRVICNELWVVQGGTVRSLEGGFDEYKQIVEQELQATL
ncbi:ATP-binding cassette sub-family F member 3-like [Octopus vulgaris]|uniref:ATP-binding cassette sub-family F member 3-like n=2 Tax=Octopus TaxID=6643 RepID=A0AA36F939_OCTVU|nr:ATP-binding cassette sub-family F member 3 [Octopus sinensis]CAI9729080.1 ATP-binding cassette sub-family F member 3-like [Octopus vulgaris]